MLALYDLNARPKTRERQILCLPETRPSILDPCLESEPWIDPCPSADMLVLFMHNHPIAVIAGSPLECISLTMRLNQLRHRAPRCP